jgi:hypothetical protein
MAVRRSTSNNVARVDGSPDTHEPGQTSHQVNVDLILVIYADQARLDAVAKIEHALLVDQSHHRDVAGSGTQSLAGLCAQPTTKMPIHHDYIEPFIA